MADDKKPATNTTNATKAAAEGAPKPDPVSEAQTSSGPAVEIDGGNESQTYYLRPGMRHNLLLKGESKELSTTGDEAELTPHQYKNFSDKFFTKDEYEEFKKGDGAAGGASAAGSVDSRTMEQPTIEESSNAANVATGDSNTTGEVGEPKK